MYFRTSLPCGWWGCCDGENGSPRTNLWQRELHWLSDEVAGRRWVESDCVIARNTLVPLQARLATRPPLNIPRSTRVDPILLQVRSTWAIRYMRVNWARNCILSEMSRCRSYSQKPSNLHHHESHRPQYRGTDASRTVSVWNRAETRRMLRVWNSQMQNWIGSWRWECNGVVRWVGVVSLGWKIVRLNFNIKLIEEFKFWESK